MSTNRVFFFSLRVARFDFFYQAKRKKTATTSWWVVVVPVGQVIAWLTLQRVLDCCMYKMSGVVKGQTGRPWWSFPSYFFMIGVVLFLEWEKKRLAATSSTFSWWEDDDARRKRNWNTAARLRPALARSVSEIESGTSRGIIKNNNERSCPLVCSK